MSLELFIIDPCPNRYYMHFFICWMKLSVPEINRQLNPLKFSCRMFGWLEGLKRRL